MTDTRTISKPWTEENIRLLWEYSRSDFERFLKLLFFMDGLK